MWTRLSYNSYNAAVKVETQENVSTFNKDRYFYMS